MSRTEHLGTVFIAFGTFILWDFAPTSTIDAFFDAFKSFPQYGFIFAAKGGKFHSNSSKVSTNVRLVDWAFQLDILSHPKTLAFISHCGLKR